MPALMVQGTASGVGKSTLVAALCRIFAQDGRRVAPFKAQNMANNAFVCRDGGEIGRSTAVQAQACGIEPSVDMNPILLKPTTLAAAQVIVLGKPVRSMTADEYRAFKPALVDLLRGCLGRLQAACDVLVIEGAGSPAEVNLRDSDLVNMRTAELADAPVLLVADIDRGGVFAHLVGTMQLLLPEERDRVRGFVINKFRGDLSLLKPGLDFLERETGRPVLGVLPYLPDLDLPEEDEVPGHQIGGPPEEGKIRVDVVYHPRMANFTDFDALRREPDVAVRFLERPDPSEPDALVLPGTKSTIADLRRLKAAGFPDAIARCLERGATVVGICGGFQMLGEHVSDPGHVESDDESEAGLGLLPVRTVFAGEKVTAQVRAEHVESGTPVEGYEIHMGRTEGASPPVFRILERRGRPADDPDGASARFGRVWGTYVHGVFDRPEFRRHFINRLRVARGWAPLQGASADGDGPALDRLASVVRTHLNLDRVYRILRKEA